MKLHRLPFIVTLIGLSAALAARPATAEVVEFIQGLPMPHQEHFNDFSWLQVIDVDQNGQFSVGDVFEGVFNVESIGAHGGDIGDDRMSVGGADDPVEVTGYYKAVVSEITGGWMYFAPDADFEATYGTGAMVAVYEDAENNFSASHPLEPIGKELGLIQSATDGDQLFTMGFTGQDGEGWKALEWVPASPTEIDDASDWATGAWGVYQANLNVIGYSPLDISYEQASQFDPGNSTQLSFNGQLWGQAEGATLPLSDSADIFFTVVPEPAGTAILAQLLCLAAGAWTFCRRRRSV